MKPVIYPAGKHTIDPRRIDADALNVMKRLENAGHTAYLVGGGVRDLLVHLTPKDFDISTSAKPEEIKRLFRNCLLIGRRFRLAHIRFGKKVFEVSTFRSGNTEGSELVLRDNEWGSPEEDALRRDFTINGLFYDPVEDQVIDYVGGCQDIQKKLLRTIGHPQDRFTQDPVRMMRLLKFQARFGFKVDAKTKKALEGCKEEILKSSPARILEETYKMLESGASENFFKLMVESGMMESLYPPLDHFLKGTFADDVFTLLRIADDHFSEQGQPLERSVLTSCLVYPILMRELECQFSQQEKPPTLGEVFHLSHTLLRGFVTNAFPHFPRRLRASVNFILDTQFRLTPLSQKKLGREKSFAHEDFAVALKFLKVRSLLDPSLETVYEQWEQLYGDYLSHPKNSKERLPRRPYRRSRQRR